MRCNSYCVFCGQREVDDALIQTRRRLGLLVPDTDFGATRGRYTLESATAALREARAQDFTELSLQGGEPTIWPELPELVRRARTLGFTYIGVVTNGRRLRDRAFAEALLEAGLDGLSISLLGGDAETHDAISAAPGAFEALVAGARNVTAIAKDRGLATKINANLTTTARSVDQLTDEVRLLASVGAHAAQVHLVRFTGLASDPGVREPLRFDIRRIRPALATAMAEARTLGMPLHATDIPLCLHPTLDAQEVELMVRRRAIDAHQAQAAAFSFDISHNSPQVQPDACRGCLLEERCPRVPAEYLVDGTEPALVPLTSSTVALRADDILSTIDPSAPDGATKLADLNRALWLLSGLDGAVPVLRASLERVQGALADFARLAIKRRDATAIMHAFCVSVGVSPRSTVDFADQVWRALLAPLDVLARLTRALPAHLPDSLRLDLGDRFSISLLGVADPDGRVALRSVRPVLPPMITADDRLWAAVFLVGFAEPLRRMRSLRLVDGDLRAEDGAGSEEAWSESRPGALRLIVAGLK
jgi:MoaA/NifB/PqqE/SkfB family radical SAM enzyme